MAGVPMRLPPSQGRLPPAPPVGHTHGSHSGGGVGHHQPHPAPQHPNSSHGIMLPGPGQYGHAQGVIVSVGGPAPMAPPAPGLPHHNVHHQGNHGGHMAPQGGHSQHMPPHHQQHQHHHQQQHQQQVQHHHENYHHHSHHPHHHNVPPPNHYQPTGPPPPPYPSMPINQLLSPASSSPSSSTKEKTPMCLVNELARYNKVGHQYRLTDEAGPAHKKTFTVCLKIGDKEEYIASGPSIKKAQHAAAAIALEKTQFKHPSPKAKNLKNANITPTVELNALAMKRGEPTTYTFLEPNSSRQNYPNNGFNNRGGQGQYAQRSPGYPPMFCVQLRVGSRDFVGEGATAQAAKHGAAGKALKVLKDLPIPDGKSKLDPTSLPFIPGSEYDELKSPISLAHEIALKRNLQVYFEVVRETGPPHMRTFITKCIVGEFVTEGEGNGKKVSKKRAAELMLDKLKQLPPVASCVVTAKPRKQPPSKKKSRNLIKVEQKEGGGCGELGQSINPISRLIQIQQARKEKEPVYTLVAERGMPRRREFVMQVQVGQQHTTGSGPNKKLAKRAAAEALLQMLGYSRPSLQPTKPAIKTGEIERQDKGKKLTFVDEVVCTDLDLGLTVAGHAGHPPPAGTGGRQLVPGLLYIDDKGQKSAYKPSPATTTTPQVNGKSTLPNGISTGSGSTQAATIAKELLNGGTSPTADALAKKSAPCVVGTSPVLPQVLPQLPTSGQGVSPKEQLAYLSQVLGFTVTYTDFPKKGEYLSLVSLSTTPPQVSHGAGPTLEGSHNNAAHTALRTLANNGLDTVSQDNNTNGSVKVVSLK